VLTQRLFPIWTPDLPPLHTKETFPSFRPHTVMVSLKPFSPIVGGRSTPPVPPSWCPVPFFFFVSPLPPRKVDVPSRSGGFPPYSLHIREHTTSRLRTPDRMDFAFAVLHLWCFRLEGPFTHFFFAHLRDLYLFRQ